MVSDSVMNKSKKQASQNLHVVTPPADILPSAPDVRTASATASISRLAVGWFLFAGFCVAWQPFSLGFYLDDWGAVVSGPIASVAFSIERFKFLYEVDPSRPAIVPVRFLFSSLLSNQPVLWQMTLLALNIGIAAGLSSLIQAIAKVESPKARFVSYAIASSWLLMPWSVGFRFWPVLLPIHVLLIMYIALLVWLVKKWDAGHGPMVIPFLVYLYLCLGYEAFYFQFLAVSATGMVLAAFGRTSWKPVVRTSVALALAQGASALWWLGSRIVTNMQRPVSANWRSLISDNCGRLIPEMVRSLREVDALFIISVLGLIAVVLAVSMSRKVPKAREDRGPVMLAALCCILGVGSSIVAYSLGQRPLVAIGVESRTFTFVSLWLVIMSGLLGLYLEKHSAAALRITATVLGLIAGFSLGAGEMARGTEWANAWSLQKKYLAAVPVEKILKCSPTIPILALVPMDYKGAPVFAASWDINNAIPFTYPAIRGRQFVTYNPWLGPLTWDGRELKYSTVKDRDASELFVWIADRADFYKASEPFTVGQDLRVSAIPAR